MNKHLFDSSAWLEYFLGDERFKKFMQPGLLTPVIVVAELADKYARKNTDFKPYFNFLKLKSYIVPFTVDMCLKAGMLKVQRRKNKPAFSLADALIYQCAIDNNAVLITTDYDFEGMEKVKIIRHAR